MLQIRYAIILLLIGFFVLQIVRQKVNLLQMYAFFIPYFGIDFDIGVRFTLSQLLLLIINGVFFVNISVNINLFERKGFNKYVFLFLFYAFLSTILISTFIMEYISTSNPGFLRNEGRYISQIINYSILFSVIYIIHHGIKNLESILKIVKYFILGIIILGVLGFLQQLFFIFFNLDILPLPLGVDGVRVAGTFDYFGIQMIRICSLAGEPKSLGMFLAIGIVIVRLLTSFKIKLFKFQTVIVYLLLSLLFLTLSTSGFLLLAILWVASELILRFSGILPRISILSLILGFLFISALIYLAEPIENVINDRVFERDLTNEDFDAVVKSFLIDNPHWLIFGSGIGNIHNLASPYIPDQLYYFMQENIFVAKSGYLRIISETGLVGFLLFIIFNLSIISKSIFIYIRSKQKILFFIGLSSILLFLAYMARGLYVTEAYLFFLALANTLNSKSFEWGISLPQTEINAK